MRSSSLDNPSIAPALKAIDARFSEAGLVRSRRHKPGGHTRSTHFERAAPEELTHPAPVPSRAANGVEWLPVPGLDLPWLWAGFSTRKGGLSRAYCADDAPGELNLGFTAADDRQTVPHNRRLLAEAITGDAGTPIIALRRVVFQVAAAARPATANPAAAAAEVARKSRRVRRRFIRAPPALENRWESGGRSTTV